MSPSKWFSLRCLGNVAVTCRSRAVFPEATQRSARGKTRISREGVWRWNGAYSEKMHELSREESRSCNQLKYVAKEARTIRAPARARLRTARPCEKERAKGRWAPESRWSGRGSGGRRRFMCQYESWPRTDTPALSRLSMREFCVASCRTQIFPQEALPRAWKGGMEPLSRAGVGMWPESLVIGARWSVSDFVQKMRKVS